MLADPKTGRKLVTTAAAAEEFGCSPSHIRGLAREGKLTEWRESARIVLYDLEEVRKLAREHKATRKRRGGRPPKGSHAA